MKIRNSLLLVLICLTFVRCTKDFIESDLNNPALTSANIILTKTIDTNGIISSNIQVGIGDKNGNYVAIKDGWVKVDGKEMKLKQNIVDNKKSYYYSAEDIYNKLEINMLYNFEIKLSDDKVYNASITTQDKDLHELTLPDYQPLNTDMQISWKEIDPVNPIRLTLICKYENNGTIFSQGTLGFLDAQKGTLTISKDQIKDSTTKLKEVLVTISSTKSGTFDNRLNTGSDIISTFNIEKSCVVK